MGYPTYAYGLKPVCMRITRLKPFTVVEPRADQKAIKVLVSELNPPMCALIKEMAKGGAQGSVPINFASTATMARICPPKPCPCEPCKKPTLLQILAKTFGKGSRLLFLGGCIYLMWYVGGFGPTMDTWNLKECVKNYYFACRNIQYVYLDKCYPMPEEDTGPICYDTVRPWNRRVMFMFDNFYKFYLMIGDMIHGILNYEECDNEENNKKAAVKDDVKKEEQKKPENKSEKSKNNVSYFNSLDPERINCSNDEDYFAQVLEMMRED